MCLAGVDEDAYGLPPKKLRFGSVTLGSTMVHLALGGATTQLMVARDRSAQNLNKLNRRAFSGKVRRMHRTQDSEVNALIGELLTGIRGVLGDRLVGLYLYGSLVAGDFDKDISDIDLLDRSARRNR